MRLRGAKLWRKGRKGKEGDQETGKRPAVLGRILGSSNSDPFYIFVFLDAGVQFCISLRLEGF